MICAHRMSFLALAAAALLAQPARAADPIKIGVTVTQSPPGSVIQGTQVRDGLEVVQKMINDQGGIDGRPIELIVEDTQGIPEKARAAVEKLITRDKVVAITGEHQSSNVLAAIEVAHRYHVPYVNTNGWADAIREKGYPEVFNPSPYNSLVAISTAEVLKGLKAKRVVTFAENTDYGIGLAKGIGEQIKTMKLDIDYKFETLDRTSKDFLPAVLPLRGNPPDVVIDTMLPPAAYILMNQVYEQGIAPAPKTAFFDASDLVDYPDCWRHGPRAFDEGAAGDQSHRNPRPHHVLAGQGLQVPAVGGHPASHVPDHPGEAEARRHHHRAAARAAPRDVEDRA